MVKEHVSQCTLACFLIVSGQQWSSMAQRKKIYIGLWSTHTTLGSGCHHCWFECGPDRWHKNTSKVKGHLLGHVHASDAVAVDAVVEGRVIQEHVGLHLLQYTPRLLSRLPLTCRKEKTIRSEEKPKLSGTPCETVLKPAVTHAAGFVQTLLVPFFVI